MKDLLFIVRFRIRLFWYRLLRNTLGSENEID